MYKLFFVIKFIYNSFIILIILIFIFGIFINLIPSYSQIIHPLLIGIILLILSTINSLNLNLFFDRNWLSILIFLIIVGGILILFLYFTRFVINIKINLTWQFFTRLPTKRFIFFFFIILCLNYNIINYNYFESYNEGINLIENFEINFLNNNNLFNYNIFI